MFKKLHMKIAVFVSIMLIVTVVLLMLSSYLTLKPMITEDGKNTTQNVTNSLEQNIELQLKSYDISLLRLANGELTRAFVTNSSKEAARLFNDDIKQIKENDDYVAMAYIGTAKKRNVYISESRICRRL